MLSCHGTVQVKYATPAASSYGMISLGLLLVTGLRPVRERSCRHRPGTVTGNGNPAQNDLLCATSLLTTEPVPVAQNGGYARGYHECFASLTAWYPVTAPRRPVGCAVFLCIVAFGVNIRYCRIQGSVPDPDSRGRTS